LQIYFLINQLNFCKYFSKIKKFNFVKLFFGLKIKIFFYSILIIYDVFLSKINLINKENFFFLKRKDVYLLVINYLNEISIKNFIIN
jgi:hypothetical protein